MKIDTAFSTVWLAQERWYAFKLPPRLNCPHRMYVLTFPGDRPYQVVAVKVARANARQVDKELRLHRMLVQTGRESDSRKHIVMSIDDLRQTGPNREHDCLVFEPMGPSLP